MIKINLLGDVKGTDNTASLLIGGYLASLLIFVGALFFLYQYETDRVEALTGDVEVLEAQLRSLKEKTKTVADLERKSKELDDKLNVIAVLKKSKSGPVRMLDDLNTAVPEKAWITAVDESEGNLKISGFALDNQTIAEFMKDLARSEYFEGVDLVETKVAARDGVRIKSFILSCKISYLGKGGNAKLAAGTTEEKKG